MFDIEVKDYYREDGKIDMCQALIEMLEDERREGEKIGERIGEKRGKRIGEKRGIKKAQDLYIRNLMESMHLTEEQAAAALKINQNHRLGDMPKRAGKYRNRKNSPGI